MSHGKRFSLVQVMNFWSIIVFLWFYSPNIRIVHIQGLSLITQIVNVESWKWLLVSCYLYTKQVCKKLNILNFHVTQVTGVVFSPVVCYKLWLRGGHIKRSRSKSSYSNHGGWSQRIQPIKVLILMSYLSYPGSWSKMA